MNLDLFLFSAMVMDDILLLYTCFQVPVMRCLVEVSVTCWQQAIQLVLAFASMTETASLHAVFTMKTAPLSVNIEE